MIDASLWQLRNLLLAVGVPIPMPDTNETAWPHYVVYVARTLGHPAFDAYDDFDWGSIFWPRSFRLSRDLHDERFPLADYGPRALTDAALEADKATKDTLALLTHPPGIEPYEAPVRWAAWIAKLLHMVRDRMNTPDEAEEILATEGLRELHGKAPDAVIKRLVYEPGGREQLAADLTLIGKEVARARARLEAAGLLERRAVRVTPS